MSDRGAKVDYPFLEGGGEMGELISKYDWSKTAVGPLDSWPLSMRTAVAMMLTSRFPMLIFWGKELITFYNDAFRPSLGNDGKHPGSLGQRGEESWAESWPVIGPMIHAIMAGSPAVWFEDQKLPIYREGKMDYAYWTYSFSPLRNDDEQIGGLLVTCAETTKAVESLARLAESEAQLQAMFSQAPAAIAILGKERLTIKAANDFYCEIIDKKRDDIIGKSLFDVLPEMSGQGFDELMNNVIATGISYRANEVPATLNRNGRMETFYVDLSYNPIRETDGTISGVFVVANDITTQVKSRRLVEESRQQLLALFEQAPVGIAVLGKDNLTFQAANSFYGTLVDRSPSEIINRPLLEALPEITGQGFDVLMNDVIRTGKPFMASDVPAVIRRGSGLETIFVNLVYEAMREPDGSISGVLCIATDVTATVNSRKVVEESERRFRSLIEEAPVATAVYTGTELIIDIANDAMIRLWGKSPAVIRMPLAEALPELEGQPFLDLLQNVLLTGQAYSTREQSADLVVDGRLQRFWFDFTYQPLFDGNGKAYAVLNMALDISEQVRARKKIEDAEASLSDAIELAELATWKINLTNGDMTYSNRLRDWLGFDYDAVNPDATGNIEENDRPRVIRAIETATAAGSEGRIDEVYTIVHSKTGRKRIVHAIGKTTFGETGEATMLSGTIQDITIQQERRMALETEVAARTEELEKAFHELAEANQSMEESNRQLTRSNEELAQYAYVASHDLQEPLRKIRLFADLLADEHQTAKENAETIKKIQASTRRMSMLIHDLLEFSRLLKSDALFQPVDLNSIVREILVDFELVIGSKGAQVNVKELPVIEAVSLQMNQLFYNLIGNALKFSRKDGDPVISISARRATKAQVDANIEKPITGVPYFDILVKDNGIGFDPVYIDQVFEVFKRLHGREEYGGSGIGLAICKRVVQNHGGDIYAEAEKGKGASFHILLPERRS